MASSYGRVACRGQCSGQAHLGKNRHKLGLEEPDHKEKKAH